MTRLLLVRHGRHDWLARGIAGRLCGVALNEQGRADAEALAARLAGVELAAICSSPRLRARETVAPLAQARGTGIDIRCEFDEVDFGEWTGKSFEELRQDAERWRQWCEHRASAQPPGGEPFRGVQERAMAGVEALCAEHPEGTVLIASHGDVVKSVLAAHLRMSLDDLETFEIACASISIVDRGPGWSLVRQVNGREP